VTSNKYTSLLYRKDTKTDYFPEKYETWLLNMESARAAPDSDRWSPQ